MTSLTRNDQAMLRGPRSVPAITRLGGGVISTIGEGQPYRTLGSDAVVYQLRQSNGKVLALRSWLADAVPAEVIERYRSLTRADTLRNLHAVENSPIVSTIALIADGLLLEADDLRTETRPLVALDWVMGPTVLAAADRACKANDTGYLAALASSWRRSVLAANEVGFVHGNLTPDNGILRPKEGIAWIDYDTAWWPGAPSIPANGGTPGYAHPRPKLLAPEDGDNFAAYLVYVSLRLLAVWPALRVEHGQPATVRSAALLFQKQDLANPDASPLFGKLRVVDDPLLRGLVGMLREFALAETTETPPFAEALEHAHRLSLTLDSPSPPVPRTSRVSGVLSSAANAVRETAARGTDRLRSPLPIVRPTDDPDTSTWPEKQHTWRPEQLVPLLNAIRDRDIDLAEAEWASVSDLAGATALLPALEALRGRMMRATGDLSRSHLVRQVERDEEARVEARRRFANALDVDDRDALRDMALAGDLDLLDDLSDTSTKRVIATLAAVHLERAIASDDDLLIMDAWDPVVFGDESVLTPEQHDRVALALDRRAWLDDIRDAIRARDLGRIDKLQYDMPEHANERLSARESLRLLRLTDQREAVTQLRVAIFRENDGEVVQALHAVERLGAPIPDDMPWREITSVVNRYALVATIRGIVERAPIDLSRLGALLPQLKDASGGVYPNAGPSLDFEQMDLMVKRAAQISRLREVLQTGTDRSIVTCAYPDLYDVIPALDRSEQARIERAVASVNRALRRAGQVTSKSERSSPTVAAT